MTSLPAAAAGLRDRWTGRRWGSQSRRVSYSPQCPLLSIHQKLYRRTGSDQMDHTRTHTHSECVCACRNVIYSVHRDRCETHGGSRTLQFGDSGLYIQAERAGIPLLLYITLTSQHTQPLCAEPLEQIQSETRARAQWSRHSFKSATFHNSALRGNPVVQKTPPVQRKHIIAATES